MGIVNPSIYFNSIVPLEDCQSIAYNGEYGSVSLGRCSDLLDMLGKKCESNASNVRNGSHDADVFVKLDFG